MPHVSFKYFLHRILSVWQFMIGCSKWYLQTTVGVVTVASIVTVNQCWLNYKWVVQHVGREWWSGSGHLIFMGARRLPTKQTFFSIPEKQTVFFFKNKHILHVFKINYWPETDSFDKKLFIFGNSSSPPSISNAL